MGRSLLHHSRPLAAPEGGLEHILRHVGSAVRDVVYPKRCAGCGARGAWVCGLCLDDLVLYEPPWCQGCGIPDRVGGCRCRMLPGCLAGTRAVGPYGGWLRGAIIAFKYDDEPDRAMHLAGLLAATTGDLGPDCLLVPTPLHPTRQAARGYNQSALLAEGMARVLGWRREPALVRTRATAQQATLGGADRQANVAGAFALASKFDPAAVVGRRVVLVDDVYTTGATAGACAEVLVAAGAAEVFAASLARET